MSDASSTSAAASVTRLSETNVRTALLAAVDAGDAIRRLYELWKQVDAKYSLTYFCERAGMPSKGYLSDVMRGKRVLHRKYAAGIARAFSLNGDPARYLKLLVTCDDEKNAARRAALAQKLAVARKMLNILRRPMSARLAGLFVALDVFCAFGLFKHQATRRQLLEYFGAVRAAAVDEALTLLLQMQLIEDLGEAGFRLLTEHFVLGEDAEGLTHVDFIKQGLADAAGHVERWFPHKQHSYFVSSTISVRRDQYIEVLGRMKEQLLLTQAEIESKDADMLIRLNMQVYPVGVEPASVLP